jgi:hypothetical protein
LYLNPENDTDETLLCFFKGESKWLFYHKINDIWIYKEINDTFNFD